MLTTIFLSFFSLPLPGRAISSHSLSNHFKRRALLVNAGHLARCRGFSVRRMHMDTDFYLGSTNPERHRSFLSPTPIWALILDTPSSVVVNTPMTITYTSEAADPAGNLTFWFSKPDGVGGSFLVKFDILPSTIPAQYKYDVPLDADIGQQYVVSATVAVSNFPEDLFQVSPQILVLAAASSSSSSAASTPASASSTPAISSTTSSASQSSPSPSGAQSSPAAPSNSAAENNTDTSKKSSSVSVGLIVGVTIAATLTFLFAALGTFLCLRRRARQRQQVSEFHDGNRRKSIDASSALAPYQVEPYPAHRVEPYNYTTDTTTADPESASAPAYGAVSKSAASSSKAAAVRQEYLRNQMRAVQREMEELEGHGSVSYLSPVESTRVSDSAVPGSDVDGLEHARRQNAALQARVQALESQLDSQWALGLSDEPPPGYIE
ncbi:hypothetical protein C8R43DRAFT_1039622 [Mycena crocata]|nr:hypothetical protein C8R43DRAFT_1039622 [Mycena crocata]